MSINRVFAGFAMFAAFFLMAPSANAQGPQGPLAQAKHVRCTFPVMATVSWAKGQPEVQIKPPTETKPVEFMNINTDEGTADLKGTYGKYDIIVRYAGGYLHLIQSFLDGPLYTTTVMEKKTADGKFMAVYSRHERTDVSLPGYTSTPEQYYGSCEVLN